MTAALIPLGMDEINNSCTKTAEDHYFRRRGDGSNVTYVAAPFVCQMCSRVGTGQQ